MKQKTVKEINLCEDYSHTSLGANCLNWQVFLESCDITALLPLIRFPFISKPPCK